MIKIRELRKSFSGRDVLCGASLEINDGEAVGLFGPSGCGKSTIARILTGLAAPDSGEAYLGEKKLLDKDMYDRRLGLAIQMVWQQPYSSLDPAQRIGAGFTELIKYHKMAKSGREADKITEGSLRSVGLAPSIAGHLPGQISGGEAQRVSLARALLFRPQLLILDEATSMLDVSTQANVVGLVKDLMHENDGSVLFISHDMELLKASCSSIYIMDNGTLQQYRR